MERRSANATAPGRSHGPSGDHHLPSGGAVAIAQEVWGAGAHGGFTITNGYHVDGWAHGLAGAGLSADIAAPLLLVNDGVPNATMTALVSRDRAAAPDVLFLAGND